MVACFDLDNDTIRHKTTSKKGKLHTQLQLKFARKIVKKSLYGQY